MTATAALNRQLRRLRDARQRWRQRVAAKQKEVRKLRVAVRDLSTSRDRWKQRCRLLQQQRPADQGATKAAVLLPHPAAHPPVPWPPAAAPGGTPRGGL